MREKRAKKNSGGDKCVRGGGGRLKIFVIGGQGLMGGGTVGEHIAPISSKTPLVLPALYAFLAA